MLCPPYRSRSSKNIAGFLPRMSYPLAFTDTRTINSSKIAVIFASFVADMMGFIWLYVVLNSNNKMITKTSAFTAGYQ